MRKKDRKLSQLKHQLFQEKEKGKKVVRRILSDVEAEYIERIFPTEKYLYKIKIYFPPYFSPKGKSEIIKDLYFNYWLKHKGEAIKVLKKNEVKQCQEAGIKINCYKYKIYLNN